MIPNKLLQSVAKKGDKRHEFLDLGSGCGRDAVSMAQNGWHVVAVEKSSVEIAEMKKIPDIDALPIEIIQNCAENFDIIPGRYSVIQIFNVLQFIEKPKAHELIKQVKNAIRPGGYVIVSGFTVNEPSYNEHRDLCYFENVELRDLFSDFKIHFYHKELVDDPGHPGKEKPHQHHVVRMVAQKRT